MFMPGSSFGQPMVDQFGQPYPVAGQPGLYPQLMPQPNVPSPASQEKAEDKPIEDLQIVGPETPSANNAAAANGAADRSAPKMPSTMQNDHPIISQKSGMFSDDEGNLKIVNFAVRRPCCSCCSVILICLIMTILLGAILGGDGGLPITDGQHQYDVFDTRSKAYDSYRLALERTDNDRDELKKAGQIEPRQANTIDIVYWIYEAEKDGGMFSADALDDIKAAEDIYLAHPDWKDYCVLEHFTPEGEKIPDADVQCVKPLSSMTIFYPDAFDEAVADQVMEELANEDTRNLYISIAPCVEKNIACPSLLDGVTGADENRTRALSESIDTITSQWTGRLGNPKVSDPVKMAKFCAYMKLLPTRSPLVDFYFDKEFSIENPVSMFTRSVFRFGAPREGYQRENQDKGDQEAEVKKFVKDELLSDMNDVAKKGKSDDTNTFYFMTAIIFDIFVAILIRDTISAVVSVLLVYFYLWYMLGSLFLASTGMLQILLSIPCAWFLFRGIFQIQYFAGLNMLTIFIVAAIGADDIFVFMDAYKQSAHAGPEVNRNLQTRLSWVWRKAGLAMAITSATTCSAFLCTCVSPIAQTRSFGIFAALVILWDYILVMSLFCTSVIVYHNRFEREPACAIPYCCGCCTQGCSCDNQKPTPTEMNLSSFHDGIEIGMDKITKFFRTTFTDFILSLKGRIIILIVVLAWLIPAIIYVAKLEPTKTAEQFLADDHPLQYSITILNEEFPSSAEDPGLRTFFAWGIDTLDQGGVNQLMDDENVGEVRFKEDFTFSPQCQKKLVDACDMLQFGYMPGSQVPDANPLIRELVKRNEDGFFSTKCFLHSFHKHAETMHNVTGSTSGLLDIDRSMSSNGTVSLANMRTAMDAYFEDPPQQVEDWAMVLENVGFDGREVKWVSLEVECATLDQWSTLPEDTVRDVYEGMLDLARELDAFVGDACGAEGVLMTDQEQKFVFMNNQRIYRTSAISGAVIGVAIAFVVLCLATRSLLLSFLSTLSILCTIMSVIGVVTMIGWTLGTVEAILISILAGFSVDYVVHLAHAYATAYGEAHERLRSAFAEMGTPVLSGMITSVLASLPLFACQIVFFAKFGTFLCFTILFSWLFANFGFMSLLATVGPARPREAATEGDEGKTDAPVSTLGFSGGAPQS